MRFIPFGDDQWFQLRPLSRPDKAERDFLHNQGEWSDWKEKAFARHLKEYPVLNKYYAKLNGKKYKMILRENPFWYGRQGMEEVLYR